MVYPNIDSLMVYDREELERLCHDAMRVWGWVNGLATVVARNKSSAKALHELLNEPELRSRMRPQYLTELEQTPQP